MLSVRRSVAPEQFGILASLSFGDRLDLTRKAKMGDRFARELQGRRCRWGVLDNMTKQRMATDYKIREVNQDDLNPEVSYQELGRTHLGIVFRC